MNCVSSSSIWLCAFSVYSRENLYTSMLDCWHLFACCWVLHVWLWYKSMWHLFLNPFLTYIPSVGCYVVHSLWHWDCIYSWRSRTSPALSLLHFMVEKIDVGYWLFSQKLDIFWKWVWNVKFMPLDLYILQIKLVLWTHFSVFWSWIWYLSRNY